MGSLNLNRVRFVFEKCSFNVVVTGFLFSIFREIIMGDWEFLLINTEIFPEFFGLKSIISFHYK